MKKKKWLWIVIVVGFLLGLGIDLYRQSRQGDTSHTLRIIGETTLYDEKDINQAMNVVQKFFQKNYQGCTLKQIWYDEEKSQREAAEWAAQYGADEALVLYSNYETGSNASPSLEPNSLYSDWKWVLVRQRFGFWELKNWGYA